MNTVNSVKILPMAFTVLFSGLILNRDVCSCPNTAAGAWEWPGDIGRCRERVRHLTRPKQYMRDGDMAF